LQADIFVKLTFKTRNRDINKFSTKHTVVLKPRPPLDVIYKVF
jgi:hypothetical protein